MKFDLVGYSSEQVRSVLNVNTSPIRRGRDEAPA